jgi:hypothetical protein
VFSIENLLPFATYKSTLSFQVNTIPTVTIGESIIFIVENELPNDISVNNNNFEYNQTIVGSYDPNDMIVLEGEEVHIDNSSDYLHYIIRFQNTGNYFADVNGRKCTIFKSKKYLDRWDVVVNTDEGPVFYNNFSTVSDAKNKIYSEYLSF